MRNISINLYRKSKHTFYIQQRVSENRALCEETSKIFVEPERLQMTTQRRVACWISKATHAQAHVNARAPTPTHTHTNM